MPPIDMKVTDSARANLIIQCNGGTKEVQQLGEDESYRLEATNADGASVTVLAWRHANLVLVVIGTSFAPASVERLAHLVDARALAAFPSRASV